MQQLEDGIAWHEGRLADQPTSWTHLQSIAGEWMEHAQYSGESGDYGEAEDALRRAFAIAPPGAGPWITQARLDYTLHRLDAAERNLAPMEDSAIPLRTVERLALEGFRGDLAFHRGQYAEAYRMYRHVWAAQQTMSDAYRLAQYHWKTGDFVRAAAFLHEAETRTMLDAPSVAWVLNQRGMMLADQGRYDEALLAYRNADSAMRGWWQTEQHIGEMKARLGDRAGAIAEMRRAAADGHS